MKCSFSFTAAISLVSSVAIFDGAHGRKLHRTKGGEREKGEVEPPPPIFPNYSLIFAGKNEPRVRREWRTLSLTERLKVAT
jgi:hypothetical protein